MLGLRGSILLSAFFHTGLFALFLTSGTGGAKVVYKPQYQVRLVRPQEVPALVRQRPKKVAKARTPPKAVKPQAKKVILPEKSKTEPKKKVQKTPAKKKEPRKAIEKERSPEPKSVPVEREPDLAPEKILEETLARIEKRAESRAKAAAKVPESPSSGWEEKQKEIEYSAYYDQVERAVRANWIPPQSMDANEGSEMTVVSLTLLPDGRVLKSYIEEPSGNPLFDQSVMRAILKSTPFPPPPIGLKQQSFELGLRFHSTPRAP